MSDQPLAIAPSRPQSPQRDTEQVSSLSSFEQDRLVASRDFVNKIVRTAGNLQGQSGANAEMVRLVHHIEATQEALEKLHQAGLTSQDVSEKLFQAIIDIGQKFLACHKEVCRQASARALSD